MDNTKLPNEVPVGNSLILSTNDKPSGFPSTVSLVIVDGNLYCQRVQANSSGECCILKVANFYPTADEPPDYKALDERIDNEKQNERSDFESQNERLNYAVYNIYTSATSNIKATFTHVNGICYAQGYFLIADVSSNIVKRVKTASSGHWYVNDTIIFNANIASLTQYSANQLIVGTSNPTPTGAGKRKYYLVTIPAGPDPGIILNEATCFYVLADAGYSGNDIYYHANTQKFYVTTFTYESDGVKIYKNKILEVNLGSSISFGSEYSAARTLVDTVSSQKKFEVEGIAINAANDKFVSVNGELTGGSQADAIYRLYAI
jgi:hypothetical protein